MPLDAQDIADLLLAAQPHLGGPSFTVTQDHQKFEVVDTLFRKDRQLIGSGHRIEKRVMLNNSGHAKHTQLYGTDTPTVQDVLSRVKVEWTHHQTDYSFDRREMLMARGAAEIVSLMKVRRVDGVMSMANLCETDFWAAVDISDSQNPWGLKYWICPIADGSNTAGFYGGFPSSSGHTTIGAIAPCTSGTGTSAIAGGESKWRNYAAGGDSYYTGSINRTAIKTMARIYMYTGFQAPVTVRDMVDPMRPTSRMRIYCNIPTKIDYEEMQRDNNDKLGRDLDPFNGITAFRRVPVTESDSLDSDTYNPVYFVDLNTFYPVMLAGDNMVESRPAPSRTSHNVVTVFIDLSYNYICIDRRRNGVMRATA